MNRPYSSLPVVLSLWNYIDNIMQLYVPICNIFLIFVGFSCYTLNIDEIFNEIGD